MKLLLCDNVVQALMLAHGQVAERNFVASLADIPHEVDEDDDAAVKIIQLVKSFSEPLVRTFTPLSLTLSLYSEF